MLQDFPESCVDRKAWDSYCGAPCFSITAICESSSATTENVYGNCFIFSEFCPADTVDQCNPPSTVNSSDPGVRISPCCGSANETCKIVSLIPACGSQVSPPSSVVRMRPPLPAA